MNELFTKYKCDRCGEYFHSYMTYTDEYYKVCGTNGCFDKYQNDKRQLEQLKKPNEVCHNE